MPQRATYRCFIKATRRESGAPRRSHNWIAARRSWLAVSGDRITCGDWEIPVERVRSATLYWFWQIGIPGRLLEVTTDTDTYQFGINPWCRIAKALPFPFDRETVWLRSSAFSVALRFVALGLLAYWVWLVWR